MKTKRGRIFLVYMLLTCLIALIIEIAPITEPFLAIPGSIIVLKMYSIPIMYLLKTKEKRREKRKIKKQEKEKKLAERRETAKQEFEKRVEQLQKEREWHEFARRMREMDATPTPTAAKLLFVRDKYGVSLTGTLALTLLGGAIGGTFGAAYGASKACNMKTDSMATFSVQYKSGLTSVEEVEVGSYRFQQLAKLCVN